MFDIPELSALDYSSGDSTHSGSTASTYSGSTYPMELPGQQQSTCSKRLKVRSRTQVQFQEEHETFVHEPLHDHEEEAVFTWYTAVELKAIHKEIFCGLVEAKERRAEQMPANFEFSARGLEEIRKRKPHKRQVRRQDYIQSVVALMRKHRCLPSSSSEEVAAYAVRQSKSAALRALHYAALDADEACQVYQETFGLPRSAKNARDAPNSPSTSSSPHRRRVMATTSLDSVARSA